MGYQEEDMQAIRNKHIANLPATESQMRSFAYTILAPAFALAAIGVLALVPSPKDIYLSFKPVGEPLIDVATGARDGREDFQNLAERIASTAADKLGTNADCFENLSLAGPEKLDRCGRVVYQVLAEVEDLPPVFTADNTHPVSRETLVQELKLAATEVCRERWVRTGTIPKDSPACAVSMAALETQRD